VRFAYEWRDDSGQWYRSYGNENWELTTRPHAFDREINALIQEGTSTLALGRGLTITRR